MLLCYRNKKSNGFTIIELIVVIVVIGILSSIVIIGYGGWRRSTISTRVKSDLGGVSSAMEDSRTFTENGYPEDVAALTTLKPSEGVILSGGGLDGGKSYCVNADNSEFLDLDYYIDSRVNSQSAQLGSCPVNVAKLRLFMEGSNSGKIVVTDGLSTKECVKGALSDKYCRFDYRYYANDGHKQLTSVVAVPDNPGDIADLRWHDYWQCPLDIGTSLQTSAINNLQGDDSFHVNFGAYTYVVTPASHNC